MTLPARDGGSPVRKEPWPTRGPRFGKEELQQLEEALEQNTLFYMYGQKTRDMCAKMAGICGARHVLACSSGSAALHGATKAVGVGPGDEVITSPITDAGTILGIVYEGAIPVFADIDPDGYNITAASIEARITPRTRAVIVVHLAGCAADIEPIVALCQRRNIKVIEDCAQSWGATVAGRWVGTFGDFGCFSLNDFKHISTGDGGLIVTDNEDLYHAAWLSIDKCYDRAGGNRSMPFAAPNYRISELQSAVGIAQLDRVEHITSTRARLGARLTTGLDRIRGVNAPKTVPGAVSTYWFFLMQIEPETLGIDIQTFTEAMNTEGIPGHTGYAIPVYLAYEYLKDKSAFHHSTWPFSAATELPPYGEGYCPNAEKVLTNCFNFPLNEWITEREIDDTLAAVEKIVDSCV